MFSVYSGTGGGASENPQNSRYGHDTHIYGITTAMSFRNSCGYFKMIDKFRLSIFEDT